MHCTMVGGVTLVKDHDTTRAISGNNYLYGSRGNFLIHLHYDMVSKVTTELSCKILLGVPA